MGKDGREFMAARLGKFALALGKPEDALRSVENLRAMQPELPWPHLIAGQALLETGQPKEAVVALERSLATNPFDPEVHCALAEAYERADTAAAVTEVRRQRAERHCRELRTTP